MYIASPELIQKPIPSTSIKRRVHFNFYPELQKERTTVLAFCDSGMYTLNRLTTAVLLQDLH